MEYKALTFINLPFLDGGNGRLYRPGDMIPEEDFGDSVSLGEAAIGETEWDGQATAESMIAGLIDGGSLSEDPNADLHPDHQVTYPGTPTVTGLIEGARALVADMEAAGQEVPDEVRLIAEMQELKSTDDAASGGDSDA